MRVRYPPAALVPDAMRAAGGVALAGLPLAFMETAPVATGILGVLTALFALFACHVWRRYRARFEFDRTGVRAPGAADIRWDGLERLRLRWFSVRREPSGRSFGSLRPRAADALAGGARAPREGAAGRGWLELELRASGTVIRVDSRLERFAELVELAVARAEAAGLELDPVSTANLDVLRRAGGAPSIAEGLRA